MARGDCGFLIDLQSHLRRPTRASWQPDSEFAHEPMQQLLQRKNEMIADIRDFVDRWITRLPLGIYQPEDLH
jgi:hypothetical protein